MASSLGCSRLLVLRILVIFYSIYCLDAQQPQVAQKPHIIMIVADDLVRKILFWFNWSFRLALKDTCCKSVSFYLQNKLISFFLFRFNDSKLYIYHFLFFYLKNIFTTFALRAKRANFAVSRNLLLNLFNDPR